MWYICISSLFWVPILIWFQSLNFHRRWSAEAFIKPFANSGTKNDALSRSDEFYTALIQNSTPRCAQNLSCIVRRLWPFVSKLHVSWCFLRTNFFSQYDIPLNIYKFCIYFIYIKQLQIILLSIKLRYRKQNSETHILKQKYNFNEKDKLTDFFISTFCIYENKVLKSFKARS